MKKINCYRILSKIHESKNSTVFLVHNESKNKKEVLKVFSEDSPFYEGVFEEFCMIKQFDHPNLIQANEFGFFENKLFYSMPYYKISDIRQYCKENPVSFHDLLLQMLEGLSYLHKRNKIHGDLSFSNILFINSAKGYPTIKISDFGMSSLIISKKISDVSGTVFYIAPELLKAKDKPILSVKTDIYALGIILQQIVYGITLESNLKTLSVPLKININEPAFNIKEDYENVIRKMVHNNPSKRYSTISEIKKDLNLILPKFSPHLQMNHDKYTYFYYQTGVNKIENALNKNKIVCLKSINVDLLKRMIIPFLKAKINLNRSHTIDLQDSTLSSFDHEQFELELKKFNIPLESKLIIFFSAEQYRANIQYINELLSTNQNWKAIIVSGENLTCDKILTIKIVSFKKEDFETYLTHLLGEYPPKLFDYLWSNTNGNVNLTNEIIRFLLNKNIIILKRDQFELTKSSLTDVTLPDSIISKYVSLTISEECKTFLNLLAFWKKSFTLKQLSNIFPYSLIQIQDFIIELKKTEILYQPSKQIHFLYQFVQKQIQLNCPESDKTKSIASIFTYLEHTKLEHFEEIELLLRYAIVLDKKNSFIEAVRKYSNNFHIQDESYYRIFEISYNAREWLKNKPDELLQFINTFFNLTTQKRDFEKMKEIHNYAQDLSKSATDKNELNRLWLDHFQILSEDQKWQEIIDEFKKNQIRFDMMSNQFKSSLLLKVSYAFFQLHEHKKALEIMKLSIKYTGKKEYNSLCYAYKMIGIYLGFINDYEQALESFEKAVEFAKKINLHGEVGHIYCQIGFILLEKYKIKKALEYFQKAQQITEEYKVHYIRILVTFGLMQTYLAHGNFWQALCYSKKFKEESRETNNDYFYTDLPSILCILGYYKQAEAFTEKSLKLLAKNDKKFHLFDAYCSYLEILIKKKDDVQAKEVIAKLESYEPDSKLRMRLYSYYLKILFLIQQKDIVSAEKEISKMEQNSQYKNYPDSHLFWLHAKSMILFKKDKIEKAYSFSQKAIEKLEKIDYQFMEAPEMLYLAYKISKKAFLKHITTSSFRTHLKKAYSLIQQAADNLPTNQMKRTFLYSTFRAKIIKSYENELNTAKYTELTSSILKKLETISQLISNIQDRKELMSKILEVALDVTQAERGIIFSYDTNTSCFKKEFIHQLDSSALNEVAEVNQKILETVISKEKPIYHTEVLSNDVFDPYQSYVNFNIQSIICLPLKIHGNLLGSVYLDSRRLLTFTPEEFKFLTIFAQTAASAIQTSHLYEKLSQKNESLVKNLQKRQDTHDNIIGNSSELMQVLKKIEQIAPTDVNVLVEGESGTGKELVAKAIHQNSKRKSRVFIPVDCGSLTEDVIESELFGHKKGAFTGAHQDKKGLFEEANFGTIFLDEISNLSLQTQTKLLRLIQEGELKRVGETKIRRVDVRIIAASNVALKQMVIEGRFRQDLFYRLSIFPIVVPALRNRKTDICILALHFLSVFKEIYNKDITGFRDDAFELLESYAWPGNIRQLQNEIERAVIVTNNKWLSSVEFSHLKGTQHSEEIQFDGEVDFNKEVDSFKLKIIKEALKFHNNNWSKAAKHINISRQSMKRMYERIVQEQS